MESGIQCNKLQWSIILHQHLTSHDYVILFHYFIYPNSSVFLFQNAFPQTILPCTRFLLGNGYVEINVKKTRLFSITKCVCLFER